MGRKTKKRARKSGDVYSPPAKRPGKAKPAARQSVDDAVRQLSAVYGPHRAADELSTAARRNDVRVWCDGYLLPPDYIAVEMRIAAKVDADGRVRGVVVPARGAWEKPADAYRFEVDSAGVTALRRTDPVRGKPGRKRTKDWPLDVGAELIRIALNSPHDLRNLGALATNMKSFLQREGGWAPSDEKAIEQVIRGFLRYVRDQL